MLNKLLRMLFHRTVIVGVSIALQVAVLLLIILQFGEYFIHFYAVCTLLSMAILLYIINSKLNPAYKIAWIIPILTFPIFGGVFYLMFGSGSGKRIRVKMDEAQTKIRATLVQSPQVMERLDTIDRRAANQTRYLQNYSSFPVYENTTSQYLTPGEMKFERMKEELRRAEHYIFLEYFIIGEGKMWGEILEILQEKAAQGVDVRVMYDDVGCLYTLPYKYNEQLEKMGIQCCVFNPFIPILSIRLNNRDHRKIAVIDGHTAFTGGINLDDEYINAYPKHGHWKDSSVVLQGEAVWSFTVMFLSLWGSLRGVEEDFEKYRPRVYHPELFKSDGFVAPYSDSPLDGEAVSETVYMSLINQAKDYVYIFTPYLIIDNEMTVALCTAAKSGVDVRIVTPHVADKWFVHAVTRANYELLVENQVKIYEYTPGFVHAKTFVVDDVSAVVGTINLDYRSLYLHFECGAWLYGTKSVLEVRDDFLKTLEVCQQVSLEECRKVPWYTKVGRSLLQVFAPLM